MARRLLLCVGSSMLDEDDTDPMEQEMVAAAPVILPNKPRIAILDDVTEVWADTIASVPEVPGEVESDGMITLWRG